MYLIGVSHFPNEMICLLFNILFVLWIALEAGILMKTAWRSFKGEKSKSIKDSGSYFLVAAGNWVSVALSIIMISGSKWMLPMEISAIGLMLLAFGIIFRFAAFWTLRKYFTVTVTTDEKQHLIQEGPYRYIRHPAYTGSICITLGIALALRTTIGFCIGILIMIVIYKYRIAIEEKALKERFGSAYDKYMKSVGCIVPHVIRR